MTQEQARQLWIELIHFAAVSADLAGEGNSGEFHDAEQAEYLEKCHRNQFKNLKSKFEEATGYVVSQTGDYQFPFETNMFPKEDEWVIELPKINDGKF